ncbi:MULTISPECIES: nucleotide exchange factor GrpE [Clostridium]|uniref:Protein GrpE n=1 Tax=Clostridium ragsdalei P11 TaxID=1353534 RepID=A0A1A6AVN4_9CLOT|nr:MULTISPECIES: nucleotide exchange factor GrpE [Clostridium]OBR94144.1 protein GrpE [Clostridium ragsdalei P11]QXE20962.1 nucleotide exchange factor GrpE [Clostridium sp. 001]
MFSIENELKSFKKKSINTYEVPLNDLYDVETKINSIDKTNKRNIMSMELLKEELEEKNDQIASLKRELTNGNKREEVFVKKVLAILDQVDNVCIFAEKSQNEALISNTNSVMRIIRKELRELEIEEIPTIGEIFNPELHECVEAVHDNTKNKYEIIDVIRKGYKMNGKVIRIASVIAVR